MNLLEVLESLKGEKILDVSAESYEAENDAAKAIKLKLNSGKTLEISSETFEDGDPYDAGSSYSKLQVEIID